MCEGIQTLGRKLEIKVPQVCHCMLITLVSTHFVKFDRLIVILDSFTQTLFKAQTQVVQCTVTVTCLPEAVDSLFVLMRVIVVE